MVGGAAAYGASGEATAVEGMLLNDANVVRGGIATELESANGLTAEELSRARTVPNGQMGITTVGNVRAAGGQVTPTSGASPNHATVSGLSPAKATELLSPAVRNPNPAPKN